MFATKLRVGVILPSRTAAEHFSSYAITKRNRLFDEEAKRQKESVGRLEKIKVTYLGPRKEEILLMNKNISTPYDCARHLGETLAKHSAVALLDSKMLWHMHRPLPDSCSLKFLTVKSDEAADVNKIFWRTCSFLLGQMATVVFKDNVKVHLHSFPSPNVRSGSFIYDLELENVAADWSPSLDELRILSSEMVRLCRQDELIECLTLDLELAKEMFESSKYKKDQLDDIAKQSGGTVTLFRAGDHIDVSKGPMLNRTGIVGRCSVTGVHRISKDEPMFRFQGVALPAVLPLDHFSFSILEERAKTLNPARIPLTGSAAPKLAAAVS